MIINNRTGYLVKKHPASIGKTVEELLLHPDMQIKIGHLARENIVKNWNWNKSLKNFEDQIFSK